jgi:hypothetical protein
MGARAFFVPNMLIPLVKLHHYKKAKPKEASTSRPRLHDLKSFARNALTWSMTIPGD